MSEIRKRVDDILEEWNNHDPYVRGTFLRRQCNADRRER